MISNQILNIATIKCFVITIICDSIIIQYNVGTIQYIYILNK